MQKRDELNAELNIKLERAAELRGVEGATDELIAVSAEIRSIKDELDVLAAREAAVAPVESTVEAPKSLGRSAADALAGKPVGTSVEVRGIIANPFGSGDDVTMPQQIAGISAKPDAPVRFLDVVPTAVATSDVVTYIKEDGFQNAAAARLAGSTTAESEITFAKVSEPVANTAHLIRVAEETLADAPALSQVIDRRGVSGLRTKLNGNLLASASETNGVKSIVAQATELEVDLAAVTLIDAVLSAKTSLEEQGFVPTVVVMSPANVEAVRTAKLNTGAYLGAGPFAGANATLWGLTIISDGALQGCEALVADMTGATLYVREDAAVASDRDIVNNMVTVRVQARGQVAVERPEAFVKIVNTPALP